jgi:hypothetical protein
MGTLRFQMRPDLRQFFGNLRQATNVSKRDRSGLLLLARSSSEPARFESG